ncbi:Lipid droplet-associated hydrolase [Thalictrum thalictroides]|uniref:Lipid droplet-associated hydrolase n=1 Tax=Thalictrum thalictroides TaxID=46969 RepID=A0A7J6UVZ8_THATH|nr:Lipid droplet-associated hydrolase [Thalictrum thalictroides]
MFRLPKLIAPVSFCSTIHHTLFFTHFRFTSKCFKDFRMAEVNSSMLLKEKKPATLRVCNVSSFTTELLEIQADNPSFHVLFIPGNPGVIIFYKEFLERVYEMLDGCASVTGIGHAGQTRKNWEHGRQFSLQEQIDHKVDFIKQEFQNTEFPLLLVGHSIGSYISLEVFKRNQEQVKYCIGLYPFLSLNKDSLYQSFIGKLAGSQVLSTSFSAIVAVLGLLPISVTRFLLRMSVAKSYSSTAAEACCSHLLQYHTVRNILFMARKEFEKFAEVPDWMFIKAKQDQVAFLFGIDDHWGPISMYEEISKQAPEVALSIEREGHTHGFCCYVAGSVWVADHVVSIIKSRFKSKLLRTCIFQSK